MSVAFRRESDEEHLEPKFELPIPPGPNLVTPRGLAMIEARLRDIEATLAATTEVEARKKVLREARYWRTRQATAQLAPLPPQDSVAFGSRARFRLNGQDRALDLVGDDEADPTQGRIAFSAPLARAMMEAGVGELLDVGGKAEAMEILEIGVSDSMEA
ncbi:MAG: GreA/GreB family elongation factor [Sphingobium sp.]|uniref:GreA/GreB family elongation factor n=1 Tax=Sphingobium sp. TaxID=1912891 RepID=UPI0029B7FD81|nr:GreA/GreB family elongation factor [Sphingobium sp.]MDX3911320.1 GreA/GreB family elongation factor [Sphingobium sp.]